MTARGIRQNVALVSPARFFLLAPGTGSCPRCTDAASFCAPVLLEHAWIVHDSVPSPKCMSLAMRHIDSPCRCRSNTWSRSKIFLGWKLNRDMRQAARAMRLALNIPQAVSQAWIHRLTFEGHNAENTFVYASEWLAPNKTFEGVDAAHQLTDRERSRSANRARPQPRPMLRACVFRTADPQTLGDATHPAAAPRRW